MIAPGSFVAARARRGAAAPGRVTVRGGERRRRRDFVRNVRPRPATRVALTCRAARPTTRVHVEGHPARPGRGERAVRLVPAERAVSTTNSLGAHLSERRRVLSFPSSRDATWVAVDETRPAISTRPDVRRARPRAFAACDASRRCRRRVRGGRRCSCSVSERDGLAEQVGGETERERPGEPVVVLRRRRGAAPRRAYQAAR